MNGGEPCFNEAFVGRNSERSSLSFHRPSGGGPRRSGVAANPSSCSGRRGERFDRSNSWSDCGSLGRAQRPGETDRSLQCKVRDRGSDERGVSAPDDASGSRVADRECHRCQCRKPERFYQRPSVFRVVGISSAATLQRRERSSPGN